MKHLVGLAKKSYAGSNFAGRILVSVNIARDEKPEFSVGRVDPYRPPLTHMHIFRMNVYDLKHAKDCGKNVWIRVQFGPSQVESALANLLGEHTY